MVSELRKRENIEILYNTEVEKFNIEDNKLSSLTLKNNEDEIESNLDVSGVFIFIGYEPASEFLKDLDVLDDNNYVIVNNRMETKIPGIYACGDVIKKDVYQIITSESEGAIAATFAKKYVDNI